MSLKDISAKSGLSEGSRFASAAIERGTLKTQLSPEDFTYITFTFGNGMLLTWIRCNGSYDLMELGAHKVERLLDMLVSPN